MGGAAGAAKRTLGATSDRAAQDVDAAARLHTRRQAFPETGHLGVLQALRRDDAAVEKGDDTLATVAQDGDAGHLSRAQGGWRMRCIYGGGGGVGREGRKHGRHVGTTSAARRAGRGGDDRWRGRVLA